ncbi:MAG: Macrolide export protein MacA, partial [Verrucomicrobiota bacterium]
MPLPTLRRLATWFLIAAVAGFALYRLKFAPLAVVGHTVASGEIVAETLGTGTLEARVATTISARIQERLLEVLVDQGDTVKAGQLLARLDDAESQQQVAIAAATLAAATQTAARVRADLARSEAVLEAALLDHKRITALTSSRAVSQADADKASESLRVAEADLARSRAAIAEAEGQITVAEKTLLFRQDQLAFTRILAPYDGL